MLAAVELGDMASLESDQHLGDLVYFCAIGEAWFGFRLLRVHERPLCGH